MADRLRAIAGVVGLLTAWELMSRLAVADPVTLPPPSAVAMTVVDLFGNPQFSIAALSTVVAWGSAVVVAVAIALPVGVFLGFMRTVRVAVWVKTPMI
ncbi:ABC transporter permease, partial [Kibdelosporangium lantanae]